MSVTTRLLTAEELFQLPDDGFLYELINGELVRMCPPGGEHGFGMANASLLLLQHVKKNRLGVVVSGDTGFQLSHDPDTVLGPDVAFVRRERIPEEGLPKAYFQGPPDLALEVVSPNDSTKQVREKIERWLSAGTMMVWLLDPRHRTITVHRPGTPAAALGEDDMVDGQDVVLGFRCRVGDFFSL